MVVHIRLDLAGDLVTVPWHEAHCARVRDRMVE